MLLLIRHRLHSHWTSVWSLLHYHGCRSTSSHHGRGIVGSIVSRAFISVAFITGMKEAFSLTTDESVAHTTKAFAAL
ncbi:hypothetical protein C8J56DRAFT_910508 [Mycena floridula]|nr:hypothetical protein C8J56DRAFT_910508 [Mycena floridula]